MPDQQNLSMVDLTGYTFKFGKEYDDGFATISNVDLE